MISATWTISASFKPRWVIQGVPKRIPDGMRGGLVTRDGVAVQRRSRRYPGCARPYHRKAASRPHRRCVLQSILVRWVSVPPKGMRSPRSLQTAVRATQFWTIWCWSWRNCSVWASLKVVARAAMACNAARPVRREKRPGQSSAQGGIGGEDARPARAAEGFVGGKGDHLGKADRGRNGPSGDQTGDVRDIRHQDRADRIGDGPEAGPIRHPGIRGVPGDDDLGFMLVGQCLDSVVIDFFGLTDRQCNGRP